MKRTTLTFLILAMVFIFYQPVVAGIRCENDLISIGGTPTAVRLKLARCGEVLDTEIVSKETFVDGDAKSAGDRVEKEKLIEIWYIRVEERGSMYCYPLSFKEGRLTTIGSWSRCD